MSSFVQGQLLTAAALNNAFAQTFPAGGVSSYSATLLSGASQTAWFAALGLPSATPGSANGLATLDGGGHLSLNQLPAALQGAMTYIGTWDANANNPALVSGAGTKGYLYRVNVAGSTSLDGVTQWNIGDMAVFNGAVWNKWDGIASEVTAVAGRTGSVTLASTDLTDSTAAGRALVTAAGVPAQRVALNIDQATTVADANQTVTSLMEAVVWTSITAPRTAQLPAASSLNQGQAIYIFDESGNCSQTVTITIAANGSDTINGASGYALNYARAGVVLMRVSSTKWTAISASSPPTDAVGYRNKLISGEMAIDQRNAGASQTIMAGAAGPTYTVDRWHGFCSGANVTAQRVSNPGATGSPSQYAYQFTGASGVTGVGFGQRIEAADSYDLAGQTATLSVNLANSLLTAVTWTAYYATTADSFGTVASPTKTQIASGTFTVSAATARYVAQIAIPSAATTGIEITFTVGAQTSGTWQIGNVQLEAGTYATAFERRKRADELAMCQRYYWQTQTSFSPVSYFSASGQGAAFRMTHPAPMRTTPTVSSTFATTSNITPSVANPNTLDFQIQFVSLGAGQGYSTYTSGNTISAEL
ncbi:hypothetical protein [Methylovirgula sp. 4M-Z18]|uniref:hypothetical protein n=1 Tax=Methylovirgula sp. 4M-Z18 TaxID=2293567 RepID=UPI000E2FAF64|nr:hypothetical protein [Methylovirgula sp. 4M-Z18]RFB80033.1 hypothetical protein DYH55_00320 [Methylovirgula sp. 4M-Z18]